MRRVAARVLLARLSAFLCLLRLAAAASHIHAAPRTPLRAGQLCETAFERHRHLAARCEANAAPARPLPKETPCGQNDCFSFDGPGDYVVIGNSQSQSEDRSNCGHSETSSATLNMPPGASVKKAILYWSASGHLMERHVTASLNGVVVAANRTYVDGYSNFVRFYGAWADVTRGEHQRAYAAWSLAVVYERRDLPAARVNLCVDDFTFTYPEDVYENHVDCLAGNQSTSVARTTVVAFEGDAYKGEYFYIDGEYLGDNLFSGTTAPNLDILTFDVLRAVHRGARFISYAVVSYFAETVFGGATEGLFMPMRVVYHTLD
ncbi:hypothetical protein FGB62_87g078 [Gracilaria domingensis]|nr:hypothetical protein FGB62_87g078 [Gracilaria domingensis]